MDENAGVMAATVRTIIKDIVRAEGDRLAKLIIKTMKVSAAGMHLSAQAVEDVGRNKGSEILEEAFKLAIKYIKLPYDYKDYVEAPEPVDINSLNWDISDEEFMNMKI